MFDDVLAKDWVDIPMAPGQGPGLEGMKGALAGYKAAFPDFTSTNQDFIAAGDKVVVRSTITATHAGDFASVKATNRKVVIAAVDIHQICDGKVVRTWHVEDWLSGLFEMGALPLK
jgi:predicted ester cyclase